MTKLQYTTHINAPADKVWSSMLDDVNYREWTSVFSPGSYYEGEWKAGTNMRFLGPEKDGTVSGMLSEITEVRPNEFVSMRHVGEILHGKETMYKDKFPGEEFYENYTLKEKDGGTDVIVELNIPDEYKDMFQDSWPKSLEKLKEIAERP